MFKTLIKRFFSVEPIQNAVKEMPTITTAQPASTLPGLQAIVKDFASLKPIGLIQLSSRIFASPIRKDILHRCLTWEMACKRAGTASTKGISQVRGTTRKYRGQVNLGKSRVGTHRAPQFRKGGVAHGPKPRIWAFHLPKKITLYGYRTGLSAKYMQDELTIVDKFCAADHKTKTIKDVVEKYGKNRILFVTGEEVMNGNVTRGTSNLKVVKTLTADKLKFFDLLNSRHVVVDRKAVEYFEETFQ